LRAFLPAKPACRERVPVFSDALLGRSERSRQSSACCVPIVKETAMPVQRLRELLDRQKVKYVVIQHSSAYTAQEIAASAHIPGKELAKTVIVKINGKMAMAVLPASYKVDLKQLKEVAGATSVELAGEQEFGNLFPDCEAGAMPPFGNLYGMDVFVSESLAEDQEIAFSAGSHTELIRLSYKDFHELVKPKLIKASAVR